MGGQFDKTSKGITGKVTSLGKSVVGLAAKFTMLAGVAGIAAVGLAAKNAISTFTNFEKAIANAASVTGATGEAFEETKKHIEAVSRELGETTVFSASQAANAFYDLASAGYDVASMTKDELKPIMDLAAATQNNLTKTTEVVTSTLGQFGLGMESSGRIADVFAKTIGSSKATIEALEYSLKYVGPVAKSMGMEIEEVNAILGTLYNAGFKGEQAGTALRGAFSKLLNPTAAMREQLMSMGLTLEDVDPTTRDFADILDTLKDAGIDTAGAMSLFGMEAAPAMLSLIDSTDDIRELEDALSDAGGTAETMATQQLDTLAGSITLLKSALEGVSITLGKALAPYVRMFVDWLVLMIPITMKLGGVMKKKLTPQFKALYKWLKKILPKIKDLGKDLKRRLAPSFKAVADNMDSVGQIFNNLFGEIGSSESAMFSLMPAVYGLIDGFNLMMVVGASILKFFADHPTITKYAAIVVAAIIVVTSPILLLIAAVVALAYAWDTNWYGIKTTTLTVTKYLSTLIKSFTEGVTQAFADIDFTWPEIPSLSLPTFKNPLAGLFDGFVFEWPHVPTLTLPTFKNPLAGLFDGFVFTWPHIPTLTLPTFKNPLAGLFDGFVFTWPHIPEFKWPIIPEFRWPVIPEFKWPQIPEFAVEPINTAITAIGRLTRRFSKSNPIIAGAFAAWDSNFKGFKDAIIEDSTELESAIREFAENMANTFAPVIESVRSISEDLPIIIGHIVTLVTDIYNILDKYIDIPNVLATVIGILVSGINTLAAGIATIVEFFAEHPTFTKFVAVLLAIGAAFVIISAALAALAPVVIAVKAALLGIAAVVAAVNVPILLVIAAIALLTIAWDENWGDIQGKTKKAVTFIKKVIEKFLKVINKLWDKYGDSIIKTVKFIWDGIRLYIDVMLTTVRTIIAVAMALITGDWEGAWDTIKGYVTGVGDSISEFWDKWGKDIKKFFSDLWTKIVTGITNWAKDALGAITGWISDSISAFTDWASDTLSDLGTWASDYATSFETWASDNIADLGDWASDSISDFGEWASDVISALGTWASDAITAFGDWASDIIGSDGIITSWASDVISAFVGWAADVYLELQAWIEFSKEMIRGWVNSIIGEDGILTGWFSGVVALFDNLMNIEFSWPTIPNPFAGIDFCEYIPDWFAKFMGICGENQVTPEPPPPYEDYNDTGPHDDTSEPGDPGYDDYSDTSEPGDPEYEDYDHNPPDHDDTTPYNDVYEDGGDYDHYNDSDYTDSDPYDDSDAPYSDGGVYDHYDDYDDGYNDTHSDTYSDSYSDGGSYQHSNYAKGGRVDATENALVHEGEWVVPTSGGLVLRDSNGGKSDINITYNISGVDNTSNLKKLLDEHDRKLYKKLTGLI